jgi:hypothetical protein
LVELKIKIKNGGLKRTTGILTGNRVRPGERRNGAATVMKCSPWTREPPKIPKNSLMKNSSAISRRDFVRTTLSAGLALNAPNLLGATDKGEGKTFKIGLIGCGGRGLEAAKDSLEVGPRLGFQVKLVAIADYFKERAFRAGQRFDVAPERCFGGATAYQALDCVIRRSPGGTARPQY